jgi:hypothetical protein
LCQKEAPAASDVPSAAINLKVADKMVTWMTVGSIGALLIYIVPGIFELRRYRKTR